jgi:hypothetical protein
MFYVEHGVNFYFRRFKGLNGLAGFDYNKDYSANASLLITTVYEISKMNGP